MKSASKKGCFVVLSRSVEGRILIKNLSDTFVADPAESFTPGMVVRGRYVFDPDAQIIVDLEV